MKVTSLLENTTSHPDMLVEHGLSLYIETEDRKILFDMGQTDLFARNARALGIDLSAVDTAILSHGHYDHGGGLATFLALNDSAPVYVQRDAFLPHYNGAGKYIGLDTSLLGHPRIHLTEDRTDIGEHLTLLTCNGLDRPHDLGHFGLTERVGETFIPDDFRHEQYLLIREGNKRVLISGCSHKGIGDITEWFSPDVLIGGFHVSKMPLGGDMERLARLLNTHKTQFFTCHCTGTEAFSFMRERMDGLRYLACGQSITI